MSELDKLRELLDEAGVSYLNHGSDVTIGYYTDDPHGVIEAMDHSLQVTGLTAEQVIKALWPGTCHDNGGTDENGQQVFDCDACGCVLSLYDHDGVNTLCTSFIVDYPRFCPACGAEVVSE